MLMKWLWPLLLIFTLLAGCGLLDESEYEDEENLTQPTAIALESESDSPAIFGNSSLLREFDLPLPLFAPDSAWNQRADNVAALPQSDQQILVTFRVLLGDISTLEGYDEEATT